MDGSLNLWDDPDEHEDNEEEQDMKTLNVDDITQAWLDGTLEDDVFDAWMDTVDPGWGESETITKGEWSEL